MKQFVLLCAICLIAAASLSAGDKGVMHCFAFTEVEAATPADWAAFTKATDELPSQIPGLLHVMQGKLVRPLSQTTFATQPDDESMKKLRAGEPVQASVKTLRRQYGVCMTFKDEESFKAYGKLDAHAAWVKVYEKVRQYGTTTFQILGK